MQKNKSSSMKKILLFQFSESGWSMAAAELELLEKHLSDGAEVKIVRCSGSCYGCDLNLTRSKLLCFNCKLQSKRGINAMSVKVPTVDYTDYLSEIDYKEIQKMGENAELSQLDLRKLMFEGFDIGEAVVSILVSRSRNPDVDPRKFKEVSQNLLKAGVAAYISADKILQEYKPDLVYFFNGRGSQQRAFRRACIKNTVDFTIVEEGCDIKRYALFKNSTPHDIEYREKQIRKLWHEGDREELLERAHSFYKKRASGFEGYGVLKNFTQHQTEGELPKSWRKSNRNIVIFCSSDDEFSAIGEEWKNEIYESQLDGLIKLSASAGSFTNDQKVYLRMHPNLSGLINKFRAKCLELGHQKFEVILPESNISSYTLLSEADSVITFGSTIGMEATYWGKPSILLGKCFYQNLNSCYVPDNHIEAVEMMLSDLEVKDRLGALMYASYLVSFGERYEMSEFGVDPTDVYFRGVHLRGNWIMRKALSVRHKLFGPTINLFKGRHKE